MKKKYEALEKEHEKQFYFALRTRERPAFAPLEQRAFLRFVSDVFRHRRKQLRSALGHEASVDRERAEVALRTAGIDARRRPEELSLAGRDARGETGRSTASGTAILVAILSVIGAIVAPFTGDLVRQGQARPDGAAARVDLGLRQVQRVFAFDAP